MTKRILIAAAVLLALTAVRAEAAEPPETFWSWLFTFSRTKEVKAVDNKQYAEECSACHFAYPPGLLPSRSWEKLLAPAALENHFGENAELDDDVLTAVRDYAIANAADKSFYKRSRKIAHATEGQAPLRITEVSYIKRKHHEIPDKLIKGNPDVQSLSNCNACHTQAEKGVFDNDTVNIPNYPDWDDDD